MWTKYKRICQSAVQRFFLHILYTVITIIRFCFLQRVTRWDQVLAQLVLGTSETSGRYLYPCRAIARICLLRGPGSLHEGVSSAQSRSVGGLPLALMFPLTCCHHCCTLGCQQELAQLAAIREGWQLGHRPTRAGTVGCHNRGLAVRTSTNKSA
jgi:hypothetical protein